MPRLLFLVLCAATAAGSGAWPVGRRGRLLLAQTHVAVVPIVALLLAVACAGRALTAVRGAWPRGLRSLRPGRLRTGLVAAGRALAALAWAPPLADQLTAAGTLGALARFFLGGGAGHSTAEGWQAAPCSPPAACGGARALSPAGVADVGRRPASPGLSTGVPGQKRPRTRRHP